MKPISTSFTRRKAFRLAGTAAAVAVSTAGSLHGQGPAATEHPVEVRCGELTFTFVPQLGFVRHVRWNGVEILDGIYAAVRDSVWGTVPARISNVIVQTEAEEFKIVFEANCQQGGIDFQWNGSITGAPQQLTFTMDGVAKSTFQKNRIGFCILHPLSAVGKACKAIRADKRQEIAAVLPRAISPHQPFVNLAGFHHEFYPGFWAELDFVGDVFEMEDHRNWTDGNFKTYCTPLSKPYPVTVQAGEKIGQAVVLKLRGKPNPLPQRYKRPTAVVVSQGRTDSLLTVPGVGFGYAPGMSAGQAAALLALRPAHIRMDLRASTVDGLPQQASNGLPVEAAVTLEASREEEQLAAVAKAIAGKGWKVARWLVFHEGTQATDGKWIELARKHLKGAPVGGGTDQYFTELNRNRPATPDYADLAAYSFNPQVHAFDDESLMENLLPQSDTVRTARDFWQKPLAVTPITLRPRYNPQAKVRKGSEPDPRQATLFGAAWVMGSLAQMLASGANSVTYFETHGPAGVVGNPMYQAFAAVAGFTKCGAMQVSEPNLVAALHLAGGRLDRLVLVNLTASLQRARLDKAFAGSEWRIRMLDEESLSTATADPLGFLKDSDWRIASASRREVALLPYATAVLTRDVPPAAGTTR